jgi:fructosamine-3-kinase
MRSLFTPEICELACPSASNTHESPHVIIKQNEKQKTTIIMTRIALAEGILAKDEMNNVYPQ